MALRTDAADVLEVVRGGPPRFITVEGIDGSGKTSVAAAIVESFQARGIPVMATREPTETWLGDAVKRGNEEDLGAMAEVFLFMADRAEHTRRIVGWLAGGYVVVSDRYADSTYAYQGAALKEEGMEGDPVFWLKSISAPMVQDPDLTLLLMAEPSITMKRMADRERMTKFETLEFLEKVYENYVDLASQDDRFVILNAEEPLESVIHAAEAAVFAD